MTKKYSFVNQANLRIHIVKYIFLGVSVAIIFRLFTIQVLGHEKYESLAQNQYWDLQEIPAQRGDIMANDGYPLATTQVSYLLYGEPKKIQDVYEVVSKITPILANINKFELDNPHEFYLDKLQKDLAKDLYWVKLQGGLSPEEKELIAALNLDGIGFEEEPLRYYTENSLAAHVLGFVAHNDRGEPQGYFGIEGKLNGDLRGKPGRIIEEQDALGEPILVGGYKRINPINGRDIKLTIDRSVQYVVEKRLKEGVEEYDAVSGSVIVMDPFTGDVIAMANYPTYDPANFNDFGEDAAEDDPDIRKKIERVNLAISQTYEPGSVIKALTVASAVDLGLVSPSTTFVDEGPVQYSDYVINNWDGNHHGVQTVVQLLEKSNNIGAAWVGHLVGSKDLHAYFKKFGLSEISGIDLEGEETGVIQDHMSWTDIDLATASFGQGISATPLQVLLSFNSIANGGNLMHPRIISEFHENDRVIEIPVKTKHRVISKQTSETMIYMLTRAVSSGEAKYFNIKNYDIAGKTGTAQIPEGGKYNPNKTNATFVGFLANSKKFSMIVKLERPSSSVYAAETAVPLWMQIADDLVKYYGIAPDK